MSTNNQFLLHTFLTLLNIKHTLMFTSKLFNEHPYKYSLFGLNRMLSEYGINSIGIRLKDKEEIFQLPVPFVAHTGEDFVIVKKINSKTIEYIWREREIHSEKEVFFKLWTGIVLVVENVDGCMEPDYKEHKMQEMLEKLPVVFLVICVSLLIVWEGVVNGAKENPERFLSLIIALLGIYVTTLLMFKQLHIDNIHANKACFLFSHQDCNNVLNSPASKLFGVIGWSEIGLSYFCSNSLIAAFFPHLMGQLFLFNICALPYSFWSIWYQQYRVKNWCPLCLAVLFLFWLQFIISLCFDKAFQSLQFKLNWIDALFVYSIPFLLVHISIPYWNSLKTIQLFAQRYSSLKMRDEVFITLLKKNKRMTPVSTIIFGNLNAKNRITVLTNPHCEPCGKMHQKIEQLLKETNNGFCIQYVFTSFGKEFDISSKFLIAAYLNCKDEKEVRNMYMHWYNGGRYKREEFFSAYGWNLNEDKILKEWTLQNEWKEQSGLHATPTLLFNGYLIPDEYNILDLKFFINIDIENCTEKAYVQHPGT